MNLANAAVLASIAEEMNTGVLAPVLPSDVAADWELLGHITAVDATVGQRLIGRGDRVYFGFLARSKADPFQYIVVIRGTEPTALVEWLEDGLAALIQAPYGCAGRVHAGFMRLHETMRYEGEACAAAIAETIPDGARVVVIGHSLGSALATLQMADLETFMPGRVYGILFASPKPGDSEFVQSVNTLMGGAAGYTLVNYSRDIVPHLPLSLPGLRFTSLPNVTWITPATSKVQVDNDVRCAHHATTYAAMLGGAYEPTNSCIIGPTTEATP